MTPKNYAPFIDFNTSTHVEGFQSLSMTTRSDVLGIDVQKNQSACNRNSHR
jgi:hypothetical protein